MELQMVRGNDDREYYARRAAEERGLAEMAKDPCSKRIHLRLAEEYSRRVAQAVAPDAIAKRGDERLAPVPVYLWDA